MSSSRTSSCLKGSKTQVGASLARIASAHMQCNSVVPQLRLCFLQRASCERDFFGSKILSMQAAQAGVVWQLAAACAVLVWGQRQPAQHRPIRHAS